MKPGPAELAVGVVGCGYWGPNLARNFDRLPGCKVAALCDGNRDRLKQVAALHPDAGTFGGIDRMLAEAELDAVAIATPVRSHFPLAKACLLAGKHVLLEKPMASSSAECEELVAIARRMKRVLMVDHTYLYSGPVAKIAELIAGGEIGDLRYVNCQRLNLGLFKSDINVTWDLAPHDLSIILHVMGGPPLSLNCQGNASITEGIEDVTNMSLTFPDGRFATVQSSWLEPRKVRQMTFVGTRKMIVYDDLQPLEKIRIHDVRVERPPHYRSFSEFQFSYHYGDCHIPRVEQSEPLETVCRHFLACVAEGRRPLTCGEKGSELVRILEAASASLRGGGTPVSIRTAPPAAAGTGADQVELARA